MVGAGAGVGAMTRDRCFRIFCCTEGARDAGATFKTSSRICTTLPGSISMVTGSIMVGVARSAGVSSAG